jgi:hypothetical protein
MSQLLADICCKSLFALVDAAQIEPVSTSNSLLAGNLAGNFLKKGPPRAILASKTGAASTAYKQIPCSTEQGIFLLEQGILSREQGISRLDRSHPCVRARTGSGPTAGRWSDKSGFGHSTIRVTY